jgi:hypothetical protein
VPGKEGTPWTSSSVKVHGAVAAAGGGGPAWGERKREGQATAFDGCPASKLSMLSITCCQQVCMASWLAQPTCGVTITFGRPMMRPNG